MNMHSIQNEADYKAALKIVSALVDVDPQRGTLEADRLEALGFLVEAYESGLAKSMLQGGNLESAMGHDGIDHSLYTLADYPVLAALAQERTSATKLDGRACRFLYTEAGSRMDGTTVSAQEIAFMRALEVDVRGVTPC